MSAWTHWASGRCAIQTPFIRNPSCRQHATGLPSSFASQKLRLLTPYWNENLSGSAHETCSREAAPAAAPAAAPLSRTSRSRHHRYNSVRFLRSCLECSRIFALVCHNPMSSSIISSSVRPGKGYKAAFRVFTNDSCSRLTPYRHRRRQHDRLLLLQGRLHHQSSQHGSRPQRQRR